MEISFVQDKIIQTGNNHERRKISLYIGIVLNVNQKEQEVTQLICLYFQFTKFKEKFVIYLQEQPENLKSGHFPHLPIRPFFTTFAVAKAGRGAAWPVNGFTAVSAPTLYGLCDCLHAGGLCQNERSFILIRIHYHLKE